MRLAARDRMREHMARARRRLEAAGAPAAIDVEAGNRRRTDDRRAVGRHVDDAAPVAQHPHPADGRKELADRLERVVGDVQAAGLRIGDVGVGAGADDEFAFVRLRHIGVDGVRHHDARHHRLDRLGHQRLQGIALERHPDSGHRHDHGCMASGDDADLLGRDRAPRRLDARDGAGGVAADRGRLAILDDVDAARRSRARIAPGDRVVPRCAASPLQRRADDRIADVASDVQKRAEGLGLFGRQPFVVDPGQAVGVDVTLADLDVMGVVGQHHHAARRIHDVVVELLRQALPKLQRMLIERGRFLPQVVGADDGGVAPGVAAAEPALLEHRDIAEAVLLGEVIGGREPVPAGADDDRVIGRLRLGVAPLLRPAGIVRQRLQRHIGKGKSHLRRLEVIRRRRLPAFPRNCENNFAAAAKLCCFPTAEPMIACPAPNGGDGGRRNC